MAARLAAEAAGEAAARARSQRCRRPHPLHKQPESPSEWREKQTTSLRAFRVRPSAGFPSSCSDLRIAPGTTPTGGPSPPISRQVASRRSAPPGRSAPSSPREGPGIPGNTSIYPRKGFAVESRNKQMKGGTSGRIAGVPQDLPSGGAGGPADPAGLAPPGETVRPATALAPESKASRSAARPPSRADDS